LTKNYFVYKIKVRFILYNQNSISFTFKGKGGVIVEVLPGALSEKEKYKLLIGSILPRPIAFVSTIGEQGTNVAPFSFFTCVSTSPPMVGFTVMPGPYGPKDTLRNIRENGEFVVNIVSHSFLDKVNIAASDTPPNLSEFKLSHLSEEPSILIKPPRVQESMIKFECKMHSIIELGKGPDQFIIGEVLLFDINDDIVDERYRIDLERLEPIGRMAGNLYAVCDHIIKAKRVSYSEIEQKK
jgi:flavin reductase (DIM6/NTAB) family NADH-FMN oxidoreductase RutF